MRDLRSLIVNDDYDQGGWCHDEKRNFIHTLVNLTLSKVCVEIGVYKGSSLFSFAEILEKNGNCIVVEICGTLDGDYISTPIGKVPPVYCNKCDGENRNNI